MFSTSGEPKSLERIQRTRRADSPEQGMRPHPLPSRPKNTRRRHAPAAGARRPQARAPSRRTPKAEAAGARLVGIVAHDHFFIRYHVARHTAMPRLYYETDVFIDLFPTNIVPARKKFSAFHQKGACRTGRFAIAMECFRRPCALSKNFPQRDGGSRNGQRPRMPRIRSPAPRAP